MKLLLQRHAAHIIEIQVHKRGWRVFTERQQSGSNEQSIGITAMSGAFCRLSPLWHPNVEEGLKLPLADYLGGIGIDDRVLFDLHQVGLKENTLVSNHQTTEFDALAG